MIELPTVLILGAGASAPYGFPSGKTLLDNVATQLKGCRLRHVNSFCVSLGINPNVLGKLGNALRGCNLNSIDQFLETIQDDDDLIQAGKAAIAGSLLPNETSHSHYLNHGNVDSNDDWYPYLWNRIFDPDRKQLKRNKLSIVTFNYDRSLTHFLTQSIRHAYQLTTIEEAGKLLKDTIQIVHVHGSLGIHESMASDDIESVPYGSAVEPVIVKRATSSIRIVNEDQGKTSEEIQTALNLISAAKRVVFLGFGYLKANLKKLQLDNEYIWAQHDIWQGIRAIPGTTYLLRVGERRAAARIFANQKLTLCSTVESLQCLDFLKETGVLDGEQAYQGILNMPGLDPTKTSG